MARVRRPFPTDKKRWLITNSEDYTVKEMSKVLRVTRNSVYNQLYQLDLDYKREQSRTQTITMVQPVVTMSPRAKIGHPTNYYRDEKEIENSLKPEYKPEDLTGEEKRIYEDT